MKKVITNTSLCIVCLLLGFMLTYQIKQTISADAEVISSSKTTNSDIIKEIDELKKLKTELQEKNKEALAQLNKFENAATNSSEITQEIKKQLDDSRVLLGMIDVSGPGIVIYLTQKSSVFNEFTPLLTEMELVYLINELYFAGAEAISINETRITAQSYMRVSSNNAHIIVNDERIPRKSRIVIKAIGEKNLLETAITNYTVSNYRSLKYYDVKTEKLNDIKIPKYNKDYNFDSIKKLEKKN